MDIYQLTRIISNLMIHPEKMNIYIDEGIIPEPLYSPPFRVLSSLDKKIYHVKAITVGIIISPKGNLDFSWAYSIYANEDDVNQSDLLMEHEIKDGIYKLYYGSEEIEEELQS